MYRLKKNVAGLNTAEREVLSVAVQQLCRPLFGEQSGDKQYSVAAKRFSYLSTFSIFRVFCNKGEKWELRTQRDSGCYSTLLRCTVQFNQEKADSFTRYILWRWFVVRRSGRMCAFVISIVRIIFYGRQYGRFFFCLFSTFDVEDVFYKETEANPFAFQ